LASLIFWTLKKEMSNIFGEGLTKKCPSPLEGVEINKSLVVRERAPVYHYQAL
jgi:hypothetical protein